MTKEKQYHFGIIDNTIVCWNGNDGWTSIATIQEPRTCKQLVRYANTGEDVEELCDELLFDTSGQGEARCFEPLPKLRCIQGDPNE